jgi:hypothetical protein
MCHESWLTADGDWWIVMPRTPCQDLAKVFFNAEHRLTVAEALLGVGDRLVDQKELEILCPGLPRSSIQKEVSALVRIGAVARVEASRQVYFRTAESAFWSFAAELLEQCRQSEAPETHLRR